MPTTTCARPSATETSRSSSPSRNIEPVPGNGAKADVAITGPKFAGPVEKTLVFIDQGGTWVLQHDAALALIQAATAVN